MAVNQDFKDVIERIKFLNKLNQSEIAGRLGYQKTYLSDVINGRAPVNNILIEKIRTEFGSSVFEKSEQNTSLIKQHKVFGSESEEPMTSLPLIPTDAVAGYPRGDFDAVMLSQCQRYLVPEFSVKGAEFLIRVSGFSMVPTYNNGDLLACRKIDEITFFQWGMAYVLDTNQGVLVKRLFEDKENADNIICRSDNYESFPEFRIQKDEIRSLSLVVGMIRME